jgi:hypothetical protein
VHPVGSYCTDFLLILGFEETPSKLAVKRNWPQYVTCSDNFNVLTANINLAGARRRL